MPAIKGKSVPSRQKKCLLKCTICDKEYIQHSYRKDSSKYCSKACWSDRNPVPNKECPFCKKIFWTRNRDQIFCNRSCAAKPRTGEKSGAWKGGKTKNSIRARHSNDLRLWREKVFQRDHYTCQKCFVKGRLHAHHIKSFSKFPELRFEIDNGLTLCIDCHGDEHDKDFNNTRLKKCQDCGISTSGKGKRCRSCSITNWWKLRKYQDQ